MTSEFDRIYAQLEQLGWVDLTLLGVLVASILIGLWRGFVFEIVSLLGWLVAYVIANLFGPMLAQVLPFGDPASPLKVWVAYGVVFLFVLIACTLLARMLRALISATPLSLIDRLMGGVFGVARGTLVLVIAATLIMLSPFAQAPWWKTSHGSVWLGLVLEGLKPVLPQSLNVHIAT